MKLLLRTAAEATGARKEATATTEATYATEVTVARHAAPEAATEATTNMQAADTVHEVH